MTIYLTDDAFSVKAKCFDKMFTSILALFFLLRIANKSHFYGPMFNLFSSTRRQKYSFVDLFLQVNRAHFEKECSRYELDLPGQHLLHSVQMHWSHFMKGLLFVS